MLKFGNIQEGKNCGEFVTPLPEIAKKLENIKAYLFDWDGVFNGGIKGVNVHSSFAEADSMGTNLLRFGSYLKNNSIPLMGIITGQNNSSAVTLAKREHFQVLFHSLVDKKSALEYIEEHYKIDRKDILFVFDDVIDLPIAKECGLRFFVKRTPFSFFEDYVKEKKMCDYITLNTGSDFAVREICELILMLSENFNKTIEERVRFSNTYAKYLEKRNSLDTLIYSIKNGEVVLES